jgi:cysteine-rich repeat protein
MELRVRRILLASSLAVALVHDAAACTTNADCANNEVCDGVVECGVGTCEPAFTIAGFPLGGVTPYTAPMIAVMDHSGAFYSACCDTRMVAFSGASAERADNAALCPAESVAPTCLLASCLCGYASDAEPFDVTSGYASPFGPSYLYYDGHAGYDYAASALDPIFAADGGELCKAVTDPINGALGATTAWEGFHTFYIDHGPHGGFGWSTWYLHAEDLQGSGLGGELLADLDPGECAPVAAGQVVAAVGSIGTGSPHLHFEARRYAIGDGPGAASARVVDPYGWRGEGTDPLASPGENSQAVTQTAPLWTACGNGRVECGESCDDGNTRDGDCCDSSCTLAVAAAGTCRIATEPTSVSLSLKDAAGGAADRVRFKWSRGAETPPSAFGDPMVADGFAFCVVDDAGPVPALVIGARAPAGGTCAGKSCWRALGNPPGAKGFRYADKARTPDGIERVQLKPGAAGKARIVLKGRGTSLGIAGPVAESGLRSVIQADSGECWE